MPDYVPRRLDVTISEERQQIDESALFERSMPWIILGEPGMGKTEFLGKLGERLGAEIVSASRFSMATDPSRFVTDGKPILIDGLDEAMARSEGDAITRVLVKLEEAGSPPFVLCCRSREWQQRTISGLTDIYHREPIVATLKPFTRGEAEDFLRQRYSVNDPAGIMDQLAVHDLAELAGNPLMLDLIGKVAVREGPLPDTRSGLIAKACSLLWSEHDPHREDIGLARLSEDTALDAAGAITAALILGGAGAITTAGPAHIQEGDLRLHDLISLPGAGHAQSVLSSKLFVSIDSSRARPFHRVIAEYLGARWLARHARSPRVQRRLLAHFQSEGRVAASLRGLHALLAHHNQALAPQIIRIDPFGVLRQGEIAAFTNRQAELLLNALEALARDDPYFRSRDWRSRSAKGLMIPALLKRIRAIIASDQSNEHFRSLLIEGLEGSPLAADLADALEVILTDRDRFYREREAAAEALWPFRDASWRIGVIEELRCLGTEDSTRLASELVEKADLAVPDEMLVSTLFAELGFTLSPWPKRSERFTRTIRLHEHIVQKLLDHRIAPVLDCMAEFSSLIGEGQWSERRDIETIVAQLILRFLDLHLVEPPDVVRIWSWLQVFHRHGSHNNDATKRLAERFRCEHALRRAIHHHVVWQARPENSLKSTLYTLSCRFVGIVDPEVDIAALLNHLASADNTDEQNRADWCDLMDLSIRDGKIDPVLRELGRRFQRGDAELEAFIANFENPPKNQALIEHEQWQAAQKKERRERFEQARAYYLNGIQELRSGELGMIVEPAKAFLGLYSDIRGKDGDSIASSHIIEWLGGQLAEAALEGVEAVLHRTDLPSPQQISESYAHDEEWHISYAIMAGLFLRHQRENPLDDLPQTVLQAGLLLCMMRSGLIYDQTAREAIQAALEPLALIDDASRESFARVLIEPALIAKRADIRGLYPLAHEQAWHSTGEKLFVEWLQRFPDVPEIVEIDLIDGVVATGNLQALAEIAEARASAVFKDIDQLFLWLSVDLLVRFDHFVEIAGDIGKDHPEFLFFVKSRFRSADRDKLLPIAARQAGWVIASFRSDWPNRDRQGGSSRDLNPEDAAEFLRGLISRLADKTDDEAVVTMTALRDAPEDSYSKLIRHMSAAQLQKRAEQALVPLSPAGISALLADGPPANMNDLRALVLEELTVAQRIILGDDLDTIRDFWTDDNIPRDENRCRDRLAGLIGPELARYGVIRFTESDMPHSRRVDFGFSCGNMHLPMEVKGQWHPDVWNAATSQLDSFYLVDSRSEGKGIYCVLWFGDVQAKTGRRMTRPPPGTVSPINALEMQRMLVERIPITKRASIDVVVMDLSRRLPA